MGDFVCIFDRSGEDVQPQRLGAMSAALGQGDSFRLCRGSFGILAAGPRTGYSGIELSESLAGNREPGLPCAVLAGRAFRADGDDGEPLEPFGITPALEAFNREGASFLSKVTGSFAFIALDPRRGTVTLAAGPVGGEDIFYFQNQRWLVAASTPSAVLLWEDVPLNIDRSSVARYLGFRFSHVDATFYDAIRTLAPASWLQVGRTEIKSGRYWRFRRRRDVRSWSAERVCTAFRSRLRRVIDAHIDSDRPEMSALSLSGGLDSSSLAALAPKGIQLFSWYFDEIKECDERNNINALSAHLHAPVHWLCGDDCFPLGEGFLDSFVSRDSPNMNPFAALKRTMYTAALERGCDVALVGDGGDALYAARDYWLRDLITRGQPNWSASLIGTLRKAVNGDGFSRTTLRRLLPVRHVRTVFGRSGSPWLTATGRARLPEGRLSPILPADWDRYRFDPGVGVRHLESEASETRFAWNCGIGRVNPYWHPPLLELVLSLPAYWFHRDGVDKILARKAMAPMLPSAVRDSGRVGLLEGLFLRGLDRNSHWVREAVFKAPRSDWREYVDRSWVEPYLDDTRRIAFGHTILWRVICYELWYRHLIKAG